MRLCLTRTILTSFARNAIVPEQAPLSAAQRSVIRTRPRRSARRRVCTSAGTRDASSWAAVGAVATATGAAPGGYETEAVEPIVYA